MKLWPHMVVTAATLATAAIVGAPAGAQSAAAAAPADVEAGRVLSDRDCVACHLRQYATPGAIYTRPERKVRNFAQLRAQVARCNAELATQYFPEEEDQLTAYLNFTYYRLPR